MTLALKPTGADFDDPSLPIVGYDRLLNGGSLALIDFANANLYPGQNNSFTSVANGVPNKGAVTYVAPSSGAVTFAGGGMQFTSIVGGPGLRIGTTAASGVEPTYDLTDLPADTELLLILWTRRNVVADNFNQTLMHLSPGGVINGTGAQQLQVGETSAGLFLYYAGSSARTHDAPTLDEVVQYAWHVKPDGTNPVEVTAFRNGMRTGVFSLIYRALTAFTTAGGLRLGVVNGPNGFIAPTGVRIHRMLLEDLTSSTRDPERQVARDYQLNVGRFS